MGGVASGIREPLTRSEELAFRQLVLDHKATEPRRAFPATLHLGSPGGSELVLVEEPVSDAERLDESLRSALLEAVLRRAPEVGVMAWLTRPGELETQDLDLLWLRVLAAVEEETGRHLPYLVVTRRGWRDPRTDVARTWRRLRQR